MCFPQQSKWSAFQKKHTLHFTSPGDKQEFCKISKVCKQVSSSPPLTAEISGPGRCKPSSMDLLLVVTGCEQLDRAQVRDWFAGLTKWDFPGARMPHILRHRWRSKDALLQIITSEENRFGFSGFWNAGVFCCGGIYVDRSDSDITQRCLHKGNCMFSW